MVRARAIQTHPQLIAFATPRRANIGVRVVAVDTPGGKDSLRKTVLTGAADVIHDFLSPVINDGFADASRYVVERLVPTNLLPLAGAAASGSLQRVKNAIRILNLIERRRAFRTVAST